MDTKIEKKQANLKKLFKTFMPLIFIAGLLFYFMQHSKVYKIISTDVSVAEVKFGTFEDLLLLNATTQSLHFSLLPVLEGGVVKEIFVEDGQIVTQGQPIARLYNPASELNYLTQETNINQQLTQLSSTLLELKNQESNQNKEILQTQNEFNTALQNYNLQKRLLDAEIGKKTDYDLALQNLNYFKNRKEIVEKGQFEDLNARKTQQKSIQETLKQLGKSLAILRENKDHFLILAPSYGRLSSFNISIGQNLNSGEVLGKIDVMQGYKLVAKVDEYYHNKVKVGLKGVLENTSNNDSILVKKIIAEIKDGQFGVELQFLSHKPRDLKIGMSFGAKLKLSSDTQSFMIPKGNFYKDTAGKWIFVLKNGKAVKRKISIGRENSMYYEVISGLKADEKIIVSDYSEYKDYDELKIE